MEAQDIKMGPVATPLRVLVCGADKVPQIDKTLELFGKQTVLARIEEGLKRPASNSSLPRAQRRCSIVGGGAFFVSVSSRRLKHGK